MIDFTMFECEIELTCGKEAVSPVPAKLPPSPVREQCLQSIRKHLEQDKFPGLRSRPSAPVEDEPLHSLHADDGDSGWAEVSPKAGMCDPKATFRASDCLSPVIRVEEKSEPPISTSVKCLFLCMPVNS
ncbi:hypothetical protein ANCCAN_22830 [Ancylostoma caninum]|uniref:Uncharacterized protein n=1 Tax=Ancylostoma caninum TaxID=29170 RepID=A0A368FKP1_ANCCA|nr:hypothetical protein ANCCAN_22830 [Ancylostoma caninum]